MHWDSKWNERSEKETSARCLHTLNYCWIVNVCTINDNNKNNDEKKEKQQQLYIPILHGIEKIIIMNMRYVEKCQSKLAYLLLFQKSKNNISVEKND